MIPIHVQHDDTILIGTCALLIASFLYFEKYFRVQRVFRALDQRLQVPTKEGDSSYSFYSLLPSRSFFIDGIWVELSFRIFDSSLPHDKLKTRITVALPQTLPRNFSLDKGGQAINVMIFRPGNKVQSGDPNFDHAVSAFGDDPEEVRRFLTDTRRYHLLQLPGLPWQTYIWQGQLLCGRYWFVPNSDKIEPVIRAFAVAARAFTVDDVPIPHGAQGAGPAAPAPEESLGVQLKHIGVILILVVYVALQVHSIRRRIIASIDAARRPVAVRSAPPAVKVTSDAEVISNECSAYANSAVAQNKRNLDHGCRLSGPAWNSDFRYHKDWCVSQLSGGSKIDQMSDQYTAREAALRPCEGH